MSREQINHASSWALIGLSLVALGTVLSGYLQPPGYAQAQTDEGAAAHIFQLAIVALMPMILAFLFTADWSRPRQTSRSLVFPAAIVVVAFAALYYLEHYR